MLGFDIAERTILRVCLAKIPSGCRTTLFSALGIALLKANQANQNSLAYPPDLTADRYIVESR
jgi:hypothetical protein